MSILGMDADVCSTFFFLNTLTHAIAPHDSHNHMHTHKIQTCRAALEQVDYDTTRAINRLLG